MYLLLVLFPQLKPDFYSNWWKVGGKETTSVLEIPHKALDIQFLPHPCAEVHKKSPVYGAAFSGQSSIPASAGNSIEQTTEVQTYQLWHMDCAPGLGFFVLFCS